MPEEYGKDFEEVRELLSQKLSKEKKRLKTFGTKADSFNLAHSITRYVQALMAKARSRELKRALKVIPHSKHLKERYRVTSQMSETLQHTAEDTEKKRPWRSEVEQKIGKKERKHGDKRSSRSSRH